MLNNSSKDKIDLSIVIPMYNVEEYIQETVKSVLNQETKFEYEVILIDDGSTDKTVEVVQRLFNDNSKVSIIEKNNTGVGNSRNIGIDEARGTYIYFLDSDDYINYNMVESLISKLYIDELDLILFSATSFFEESYKGTWKPPSYTRNNLERISGKNLLELQLKDKTFYASPCLYIIKRENLVISNLRFPEGVHNEDNYFTYFLLLISKNVSSVEESFYNRRVRNNSIITNIQKLETFINYSKISKKIIQDIDKFPKSSKKTESVFLFSLFTTICYSYIKIEGKDAYKEDYATVKKIFFNQSLYYYIRTYARVYAKLLIEKLFRGE